MSEHDAATVARATVWLDTSNETGTRPTARVDDCETLAFEAPASEPPTTVFDDSEAPDAKAVLDRSRACRAFAGDATGELEAASERRDQLARRRVIAKHVATHALAFALGAAVLGLTLQLKSARAGIPKLAQRPAHIRSAPQPPAMPASKPAKPKGPLQAAPALSNAPPPALGRAVDALARGDYAAASRMYGALAAARPNDAPLAAVASILASRASAACSEGSKDPSCER